MKKKMTLTALLLVLTLGLAACTTPYGGKDTVAEYKKITATEAEELMGEDVIILDVRTAQEFEEEHIKGAVLLPNTEIADKAEALLTDKEQTILVYCRSGNRSETAARELIKMGYKNVYDFGGINDWSGDTASGIEDTGMHEPVGKPAPNFTFTDFDGNQVSLSDFSGKPVYIKFWGSWCGVCKESLPETDELSAAETDFEVITVVAPDTSGELNVKDFKEWYTELGYENITVLFDQKGKYMDEFGVRAFPSAAYIDENGEIIKFDLGHVPNKSVIETFKDAN